MNRQQAKQLRALPRMIARLMDEARDDMSLVRLAYPTIRPLFDSLQAQGLAPFQALAWRASSGAYGPSLPVLRQHPEELRRWLSHFRMARYFRKPGPLRALAACEAAIRLAH